MTDATPFRPGKDGGGNVPVPPLALAGSDKNDKYFKRIIRLWSYRPDLCTFGHDRYGDVVRFLLGNIPRDLRIP